MKVISNPTLRDNCSEYVTVYFCQHRSKHLLVSLNIWQNIFGDCLEFCFKGGHDLFNESSIIEHLLMRYSFVHQSFTTFLMIFLKWIFNIQLLGTKGIHCSLKRFKLCNKYRYMRIYEFYIMYMKN